MKNNLPFNEKRDLHFKMSLFNNMFFFLAFYIICQYKIILKNTLETYIHDIYCYV